MTRYHIRYRLATLSGPARIAIFLFVILLAWFGGIFYFVSRQHQHFISHHSHSDGDADSSLSHAHFHEIYAENPTNPIEFLRLRRQSNQPIQIKPETRKPEVRVITSPPVPLLLPRVSPSNSSSVLPNPAIVILTYNRPQYLTRCLASLYSLPEISQFRVYVSQDGSEPSMDSIVSKYSDRTPPIQLIHNDRQRLLFPDQGGTAFLAQHYRFILRRVFNVAHHSHAILIEDDLIFAPDFLDYFIYTAPLLNSDPTLFCVSSWHDNGMRPLVFDESRIFRTHFFPGLGWMLRREFWNEIDQDFPLDQWDQFMRLDTVHRGRDCLVPEISRNQNIGQEGTNMASGFFQKYLEPVAFQSQNRKTPWTPLDKLRMPQYDQELRRDMEGATVLGYASGPDTLKRLSDIPLAASEPGSAYLIVYHRPDWGKLAVHFQILSVPRSIHHGIIMIRRGANRIYLADLKLAGDFVPKNLQWTPVNYEPVKGQEGQSCNAACEAVGKRCVAEPFQFLNECSVLKKHFPCELGCRGGVWGFDVPNYVSSAKKQELYQLCLTTEADPTCEASHWSTQRLCPCTK